MKLLTLSSSSGRALSLLTICWGLWVANPYIDTFSRSNGFSAMRQIAPEYIWGFIAMFLGARALYYISYSDYKRHASNAFFGLTILWGFMGMTLLMSNWYVPGFIIYFYIATRAIRLFLFYNLSYRGLVIGSEYTAI